MTAEKAWKCLKELRYDGKKKFTEDQKRAIEYSMTVIAERVGEEMLSRGNTDG